MKKNKKNEWGIPKHLYLGRKFGLHVTRRRAKKRLPAAIKSYSRNMEDGFLEAMNRPAP